jgi:4-amino-4-deoxy-L-arabinose transferase-like glycosyltransferase
MPRPASASLERAGPGAAVVAAALLWLPRASTRAVIGYDDGAYLASVLAMRRGGWPFRDVFSSQGPLFLPLLRAGDVLGLERPWAARLVPMAAGMALVLVTHALVRRAADGWSAVLAAGLVATSGVVLFATVRIESDTVVAALAAGAVLAAMAPGRRGWLGAGLLIGMAVSVKSLMAAPALLAVLWLLVRRHGPRRAAGAVAVAAAVVGAASVPWGLADVWEQSVRLHLLARHGTVDLGERYRFLRGTTWHKDRLLVACGVLALAGGLSRLVRPGPRRPHDRPMRRDLLVALWLWAGSAVLLLFQESPLWTQHLTVAIVPVAVLCAVHRPPMAIVAVVLAVLLPAHGAGAGWRRTQIEATPSQKSIVDLLRSIEPADGLVISDEPTLGWMAGRTSPGLLVDPSYVRIEAGELTTSQVAGAAAAPDVCAILLWSGRLDGLPGLHAALGGYRTVFREGSHELLLREGCRLSRPRPP